MSHLTDPFDNWADRGMARITNPQKKPSQKLPIFECDICGEPIRPTDEQAEMYDPDDKDAPNVICHADCGLSRGLEIA